MYCEVLEEAVQLPTFFDPLTVTYSSKLPASPFQSAVYENVAEFTNDLFDINKTRKTIRFLKPDFSSLVLEPQPIWLKKGILTIDVDRLNNFGSNLENES